MRAASLERGASTPIHRGRLSICIDGMQAGLKETSEDPEYSPRTATQPQPNPESCLFLPTLSITHSRTTKTNAATFPQNDTTPSGPSRVTQQPDPTGSPRTKFSPPCAIFWTAEMHARQAAKAAQHARHPVVGFAAKAREGRNGSYGESRCSSSSWRKLGKSCPLSAA